MARRFAQAREACGYTLSADERPRFGTCIEVCGIGLRVSGTMYLAEETRPYAAEALPPSI
eukprot:scaffold328852_cov57-Tisochrysis_lutea.AAC.3